MGRITASTGIASGINISGIVTQLVSLDSQPVTALQTQDTSLTNQQTAFSSLSALLLSLQSISQNLGQSATYQSQTATSSNPSALAVTVNGTPAAGNYQYTPIQTAQSEQLLSSGFQSATAALGGGTLTYRYGNTVDQGVALTNINGGQGFTPGQIRITDRSGASAVVNLSSAQNIDDVLNSINNSGLNVTASAVDGKIQLTDNTGDTASNLQVQEVGNGSTAKSLGLSGINVASPTAAGQDIYTLSNGISLSALNDGMGVRVNSALPDITYTLHDGTTGTIDLAPEASGSSTPDEPATLGDIIQQISSQSGGKLQVSVAADGKSLEITDTTAAANPSGSLSIGNAIGSTAASDLGIVVNSASSAAVNGADILGGLKTVLLSSLNGGQGVGSLGYMKLTDRNGNSVNVNLSGSETLEDAVDKINGQIQTANAQPGAQTVGITAQVNQAGDGIELVDTTGAVAGTLTAANSDAADDGGSDGTNTAVNLGFATAAGPGSSSTGVLNSGDMHLRAISTNTLLSSLNGGGGVASGSFTITNSAGVAATINVTSTMQTVGDVVNAINRNATGVVASINSTGDGILLTDTANGSGKLLVTEGSSTTAHDLNLVSAATTSGGVQTINGSTTRTIKLAAGDSLADLVNDINTAGGGLSASILNDGSNSPNRLSLTGTQTGAAAGLVVDASQISGMSMQQLTAAQNALLAVGSGNSASGGLVVASSTNTFSSVLPGVSLQVLSAANQPVSVNVASNDSQLATTLQSFVADYNSFRSQLTTDTAYDTTTNTSAVLSSDPASLELDTQLSQLVSGTFQGTGTLQSLADVGITAQGDGTLAFDQSVLDSAWAANPQAVQQLFTTKNSGVSDQFNNLINNLAGNSDSLLAGQITALGNEITDNQSQITLMNQRLNAEQTRLYNEFYNMDLAISKLQSESSVIAQIGPLDSSGSSSGSAAQASTPTNTSGASFNTGSSSSSSSSLG